MRVSILGVLFQMPCLFQMLTGLYCPGCGVTRAVRALLSGQPVLSFFYHPFVLYSLVTGILYAVSYLFFSFTGKKQKGKRLGTVLLHGGAAVVILNFLIKNILLLLGVDVLAMLPVPFPA